MKAQTRITKHGKSRVKQRTDTNHSSKALARIVSKNGKSKGMYQGRFHQFLVSKSAGGARVKVYQDNIYIFSKNTKKLITTYKVPEKYLPTEQYEISKEILFLAMQVKMHLNEPVIVTFKDKRILKGHIDGEYDPDIMSKFILIIDGESNLIELKDVKQIETDFETMSEKIKEKLEV